MKITFSRLFAKDVKDIADYIENELNNPSSAKKLKASFYEEIKRLSDSPFLGEALPSTYQIYGRNIRRLVFKNYLIIYSVSEVITAERLLYARRDWMNILKSDK